MKLMLHHKILWLMKVSWSSTLFLLNFFIYVSIYTDIDIDTKLKTVKYVISIRVYS